MLSSSAKNNTVHVWGDWTMLEGGQQGDGYSGGGSGRGWSKFNVGMDRKAMSVRAGNNGTSKLFTPH